MRGEFYKGYTIQPIWKHSDQALVTRVVGHKAFLPGCGETPVVRAHRKSDLKAFIREHSPKRGRQLFEENAHQTLNLDSR